MNNNINNININYNKQAFESKMQKYGCRLNQHYIATTIQKTSHCADLIIQSIFKNFPIDKVAIIFVVTLIAGGVPGILLLLITSIAAAILIIADMVFDGIRSSANLYLNFVNRSLPENVYQRKLEYASSAQIFEADIDKLIEFAALPEETIKEIYQLQPIYQGYQKELKEKLESLEKNQEIAKQSYERNEEIDNQTTLKNIQEIPTSSDISEKIANLVKGRETRSKESKTNYENFLKHNEDLKNQAKKEFENLTQPLGQHVKNHYVFIKNEQFRNEHRKMITVAASTSLEDVKQVGELKDFIEQRRKEEVKQTSRAIKYKKGF